MTPHAIVLAVAMGSVAAFAQSHATDHSAPPLTVCDVLSKSLDYDGKLITIRGTMAGADEGAWLTGKDCPGALVTFTYTWPSVIWLEIPNSDRTYLHPVDFQYVFESELRQDNAYRGLGPRVDPDCFAWTYTGLFETRKDWSKAYVTYPNGTSKFLGFGHLGEAPAQLILKSVDGFVEIESCRNKAKGK